LKKYFLILAVILASNYSFAGSGWSQSGKIVELYNHGYTVMIRMDGSFVNHSSTVCTGSDFYAIKTQDTKSFDIMYSQILMAYASGKTIKFWLGQECTGQGNNYQSIHSVRSY